VDTRLRELLVGLDSACLHQACLGKTPADALRLGLLVLVPCDRGAVGEHCCRIVTAEQKRAGS
jgi:hypothetical protein